MSDLRLTVIQDHYVRIRNIEFLKSQNAWIPVGYLLETSSRDQPEVVCPHSSEINSRQCRCFVHGKHNESC